MSSENNPYKDIFNPIFLEETLQAGDLENFKGMLKNFIHPNALISKNEDPETFRAFRLATLRACTKVKDLSKVKPLLETMARSIGKSRDCLAILTKDVESLISLEKKTLEGKTESEKLEIIKNNETKDGEFRVANVWIETNLNLYKTHENHTYKYKKVEGAKEEKYTPNSRYHNPDLTEIYSIFAHNASDKHIHDLLKVVKKTLGNKPAFECLKKRSRPNDLKPDEVKYILKRLNDGRKFSPHRQLSFVEKLKGTRTPKRGTGRAHA